MKRSIPNFITMIRIILALALFFVPPLGALFIVLYLLCGLSDVLDGYYARKTHTESRLGARLDSAADFVLTAVLLVIIYPIVKPSMGVVLWVAGIAVLRFAAVFVVWKKYGAPASLHTYSNKATGFLLFLFPLSLAAFPPEAPVIIICCAATLSAAEELMIDIFSSSLELNIKSIFSKNVTEI